MRLIIVSSYRREELVSVCASRSNCSNDVVWSRVSGSLERHSLRYIGVTMVKYRVSGNRRGSCQPVSEGSPLTPIAQLDLTKSAVSEGSHPSPSTEETVDLNITGHSVECIPQPRPTSGSGSRSGSTPKVNHLVLGSH